MPELNNKDFLSLSFVFNIHLFIFMYMKVLPACMYVDHIQAVPMEPRIGSVRYPGTRVIDNYEPPSGCAGN